MTIEVLEVLGEFLGTIFSIIISIVGCVYIYRVVSSFLGEVMELRKNIDEFQERLVKLEETVNMNTYYICDILNEAEKEKGNE